MVFLQPSNILAEMSFGWYQFRLNYTLPAESPSRTARFFFLYLRYVTLCQPMIAHDTTTGWRPLDNITQGQRA